MLVFFTNLSLMEFQVRYLAILLLLSVIDGLEWFWMESFHKNAQLMLEFLGPTLFLPYINDLPDDVIYDIAIYADIAIYPRDYVILGWCPAGPVLPHGDKVPL